MTRELVHEESWKSRIRDAGDGYLVLETDDLRDVPVRLFLTPALLADVENTIYRQIVNATRFAGTKLVVITPDVHYGYGVPVGCVIATDRAEGAIAMGPVGFDIGCGMMSAESRVPVAKATREMRLAFNREVMERVSLGAGGTSTRFGKMSERDFQEVVRGGAEHYVARYGASVDRSRAERGRLPVDDDWDVPWGGPGRPERGRDQLGSLGGGNHFIELQESLETKTLFVQVHTGSRGFGHGLATNYFHLAKEENPAIQELDLGYFTPESKHFRAYLNAVAAGGNFAIVNRLVLFEAVAEAFRKVFGEDLSLVYEISHNLVQAEHVPGFGDVWTHRKGATRAFPAGHPALVGTMWEATGHPVLIPGSNKDTSYILMPEAGAAKSAYSVNHGAGRRMSRGEALRMLDQRTVDAQYAREGIVVNLDGEVPLDEAGPCYKRSDQVIDAVVSAGLVKVAHHLRPLASIKGNEKAKSRTNRRSTKAREKSCDTDRQKARGRKANHS